MHTELVETHSPYKSPQPSSLGSRESLFDSVQRGKKLLEESFSGIEAGIPPREAKN
jgi:hypothetical protein